MASTYENLRTGRVAVVIFFMVNNVFFSQSTFRMQKFTKMEGRRLTVEGRYVIQHRTALGDCQLRCWQRRFEYGATCAATNYNLATGMCEIPVVDSFTENITLTEEVGWDYWQMEIQETSCKDHKEQGKNTSFVYLIDTDGPYGYLPPFSVRCEMDYEPPLSVFELTFSPGKTLKSASTGDVTNTILYRTPPFQIAPVVKLSGHCHQYLRLRLRNATGAGTLQQWAPGSNEFQSYWTLGNSSAPCFCGHYNICENGTEFFLFVGRTGGLVVPEDDVMGRPSCVTHRAVEPHVWSSFDVTF
ncbi:uncharacterized protein LOC106165352 [Lingula anatina]|uniref:Uncharacterized protein LOC106165352 n=1 Tax=Lingula anatina TaxID=7574 RepID=A0A1S3IL69_LINAN|nr:uncharacterized protein LOC106165352 [Lingula anatina]|eukprot:XP_013398990.1 uncharacterized protein LOC106165352 [Lingula anatina]